MKNQSYTEPFRRFVQREGFEPQANEIPNTMPSWMPGEDYYTDFRKGDPFTKVDQGFARLPGAGYAALHPELKDINPEDYPDIHKMAILADVAPYSREYNTFRQKVGKQAQGNTELQIEYERILERVRKTRSLRPAQHKKCSSHQRQRLRRASGALQYFYFSRLFVFRGPFVLPHTNKPHAHARVSDPARLSGFHITLVLFLPAVHSPPRDTPQMVNQASFWTS